MAGFLSQWLLGDGRAGVGEQDENEASSLWLKLFLKKAGFLLSRIVIGFYSPLTGSCHGLSRWLLPLLESLSSNALHPQPMIPIEFSVGTTPSIPAPETAGPQAASPSFVPKPFFSPLITARTNTGDQGQTFLFLLGSVLLSKAPI